MQRGIEMNLHANATAKSHTFMEFFIVFFLGIHVYLLGLQERISKQLRVMCLHVFGLWKPWQEPSNVFFQHLLPVFPHSLLSTPLILQVSRSFPFPLDFMLLGFPLYPPQSGPAQRRMWRSVSSSARPLPFQEHQKEEDPRRAFEEPTDTPLWVVSWQMLKPHSSI